MRRLEALALFLLILFALAMGALAWAVTGNSAPFLLVGAVGLGIGWVFHASKHTR